MNTPVRATASNALARRTTSTRSLFLLTICSKAVRSLRLSFRSGSRCGVGILPPSGQVSGKDSSSGHLGHDPLVHRAPLPAVGSPRVLGVDDWSQRRGHTYGTILVDADQRRPVDLLPDRTATSLADWLHAHPSVEIGTRDRSATYAEGAARGVPQAVQVADRFHVLDDLGDAVERVLDRHRSA